MRGLLLAALVEAGIISWRDLSQEKVLPMPSDFVAVAIYFGALGLFPASAAPLPALLGWGMVLATFMRLPFTGLVFPSGPNAPQVSGQAQTAGAGGAGGSVPTISSSAPLGGQPGKTAAAPVFLTPNPAGGYFPVKAQ